VTVKSTSSRKFEQDKKDKSRTNEIYDLEFEAKKIVKEYNGIFELKVSNRGTRSLTATKTDLVNGLKLSVNVTHTPEDQTANFIAEYSNDKVFFKTQGGIPFEKDTKRALPVDAVFVLQPVDKLYLGTKIGLDINKSKSDDLKSSAPPRQEVEFKGAYASGATSGSLTASLSKKFGLTVKQELADDQVVGVQIKTELPAKKESQDAEGSNPKISVDVAFQRRLCSSTLGQGKLKVVPGLGAKAEKTGIRLGLGLTHNFPNTAVSATLAADFNVSGFFDDNNGRDPHSLGFELKLK